MNAPCQRVVFALRYRIDFVIVAASAGDRGGLKGFGEGIDLIVEHLLMDTIEFGAIPVPIFTQLIKHGADQRFVDLLQ